MADDSIAKFFHDFCAKRVTNQIESDIAHGFARFRQIEDRWWSLLSPDTWQPTMQALLTLNERVKKHGLPLTELIVESPSEAVTESCESRRILLITVSSTPDRAQILRAFQASASTTEHPYAAFLRHVKADLRQRNADWPDCDLAHWTFILSPHELDADLLYWINLKLMLRCTGLLIREAEQSGEPRRQMQLMFPGTMITGPDIAAVINDVTQTEVTIYSSQQTSI